MCKWKHNGGFAALYFQSWSTFCMVDQHHGQRHIPAPRTAPFSWGWHLYSYNHQYAAGLSQCHNHKTLLSFSASVLSRSPSCRRWHIVFRDETTACPLICGISFDFRGSCVGRKEQHFVIVCPLHRGLHHSLHVRLRDERKEGEGAEKGMFNSFFFPSRPPINVHVLPPI